MSYVQTKRRRRISLLFTTLLVIAISLAFQVRAQARPCAPRDKVVARLGEVYGETRQSIGLGARGEVIEVFASERSRTWTITTTTPGGITCLVASGLAYAKISETLKPEGAPL